MFSSRLSQLATAVLILGAASCNLGFDPGEYGTLTEEELPGCTDKDGDGFGVGADCQASEIDCDDSNEAIHPDAIEECDGIDNDCNGDVDDDGQGGLLWVDCYTGQDEELTHNATACMRGRLYCERGAYPSPVSPSDCQGQILPAGGMEGQQPDKCDGVDNDCDGEIDPRCECPAEGVVEACYDGPLEARGVGICTEGQRECLRADNGELRWGSCVGAQMPGEETCLNMGADDDCNGSEDDVPTLGDECDTSELGVCRDGLLECGEDPEPLCVRQNDPGDEACDDLDRDCDGDPRNGVANACGGCASLENMPMTPCGDCMDGMWACDGEDAVLCTGASMLNACGSCGELPGEPDGECGVCNEGVYACDDANNLVCTDDPGFNACEGCEELDNDPGDSCGVCGTYACQDIDAVFCDDPGLNACLFCGELEDVPGTTCGNDGCGFYQCDVENDDVFCNTTRCPAQPTAFRFINAIDIQIDLGLNGQRFNLGDFALGGNTVYIVLEPGENTVEIYNEEGELEFPYTFMIQEGENVELVFAGEVDEQHNASNILLLRSDNLTRSPGMARIRWVNAMFDVPNGPATNTRLRPEDGDEVEFNQIDYFSASDYMEAAPGQYDVFVSGSQGGFPFYTRRGAEGPTFTGGENYTVVMVGNWPNRHGPVYTATTAQRFFVPQ